MLSVTLLSCNQIMNFGDEIAHKYEYSQDISNANRIIIKAKKPNQKDANQNESAFENVYIETKNIEQVNSFDQLLKNGEMTSYCCCPYSNFSISFYNNEKKIDTYYADTLEFKNKIRIYEAGIQFSFIINKQDWKSFIEKLESKN